MGKQLCEGNKNVQHKYIGFLETSIKSSGGAEEIMIKMNIEIAEKNDSVNWWSKKLIKRRKRRS